MMPISSFDELCNYHTKTKWVYVLLFNPLDITRAGNVLLRNLDLFDMDSGEICDFFIPGFSENHNKRYNTKRELVDKLKSTFEVDRYSYYRNEEMDFFLHRLGQLGFNQRDYCGFYQTLQSKTKNQWSYSGECELLLFNFDQKLELTIENFFSYNLDDIVRNGRNVSEFLRGIIEASKRETDIDLTKNIIDELYASLILPTSIENNCDLWHMSRQLFDNDFAGKKYIFLSYSSKDFKFVSTVRNCLEIKGIKCWMAPFDIPRGTNYAYMIEHAIKNTSLFVLMLSPNAVNSIWVGKELRRAITYFQQNEQNKLCVSCINEVFDLSGTQFALPLEDVQITIEMKNIVENYVLISDEYENVIR